MAVQRSSHEYRKPKIAIIDDEDDDGQIPEWEIEAAGFVPFYIEQHFQNLEELAEFIKAEAVGAVCTHRLSNYGFSDFYGAKLVASLYDLKVPALLITRYADIDKHVSIRKWRTKVPVLLSLDEVNAQSIKRGMGKCVAELKGEVPSSRKPYRTLLAITNISTVANERVVDAVIPGWNPRIAVRFPVSLIPAEFHELLAPDVAFFAQINIGAEKADDLYFRDFELAPEPDDNDGLA